jgi:hypothetical protein
MSRFGSDRNAGASDVFHAVFEGATTQKPADRLELHDFTSADIHAAVGFIYGGDLCYDPPEDDEFAQLAMVAKFGEKFEVAEMVTVCFDAIHRATNLSNVAEILTIVENAKFVNQRLRENLIGFVAM